MQRLMDEAKRGKVVVARGRTTDNDDVLPADYLASMIEQFAASRFGRRSSTASWSTISKARCGRARCWSGAAKACRIASASALSSASIPPAGEKGDACGIIVAALLEDGNAVVLADASVEKASPERWARAVAGAASAWQADRVVAEANQGGAMVEACCAPPTRCCR